MNLFDDMPDIPPCPHCGHDGEGLQWCFPPPFDVGGALNVVQCACLNCGAHGPTRMTYALAIAAFEAGETEEA